MTEIENKREWRSVDPEVWKPLKDGDSIEGVYVHREEKRGTSGAYFLETKTKGKVLIWGSVVLDEQMLFVKLGDFIKIEYKGTTKNKKQQDVKLFKLYIS